MTVQTEQSAKKKEDDYLMSRIMEKICFKW